ncbi:MAG: hypothetical protein M3409_10420 [Gemmatimonadota bacterium]|jgi:hypothetical protein|nr:hypothetical protein [Gemmatimonadota bacterium]
MTRTLRIPFLAAAVLLFGGCGDATGPTLASVAGEYRATTFTVTEQGTTLDVLAAGGTLRIDLDAGGTSTGRLFLPGLDEDGSDFDASMNGTWALRGDTVRFDQGADTFVGDAPFVVRGERLEAEFGSGARVRVVLTRQR